MFICNADLAELQEAPSETEADLSCPSGHLRCLMRGRGAAAAAAVAAAAAAAAAEGVSVTTNAHMSWLLCSHKRCRCDNLSVCHADLVDSTPH